MSRPASAQIAPGVQQAAGQTATIIGTVSLSDGTFVGGADVKLLGPAVLSTTSDAHGAFQFTSVPHGIYTVLATAGGLGTASKANVAVNSDVNIQIQFAKESTSLRTIANVTTKAVGAHINVTPASIASVSPANYAFEGNTGWKRLLENIPGVAVNGGSYYGEQASGISGAALNGAVVSINGALPYETSTTLDGMPFSGTTFGNALSTGGAADLSTISMSAFDAADIVRGPGANTPSIVDSIGGSFVLHAPGAITGNHYQFSFSNDPWGGINGQSLVQLKIGRKLSAQFTYSFNNSPGPQGTNAKVLLAMLSSPATINGQTFAGCGDPYAFGFSSCYDISAPYSSPIYSAYSTNGPNCSLKYQGCYDYVAGMMFCCASLNSSSQTHAFSAGLNYKISPAFTGQFFYSGNRYSDAGAPYEDYYIPTDFAPFGPGYTGSYPTGMHNWNLGASYNIPIVQLTSITEERLSGFFGSGVLRVSALQANNWNTEGESYLANGNYTLYGTGYLCPDPSCATQNYTVFNGTSAALTFPQIQLVDSYRSNSRAFLASYGQQLGPRMNVGASFVESYMNSPYSYGPYVYQGFDYCGYYAGLCAGRDPSVAQTTREIRFTAHFDVSQKLGIDASYYWAKGAYHVYSCDGSLGGYYYFAPCSQYTDFVFPYRAPRLGLTWRANQDISFRGAVGGGFALPQLTYLSGGGGTTPSCSSTFCTLTIQNLNIQPEKSFGWDVGADFRIHRTTTASFDVYRTNLYGQFYQKYAYNGLYQGLPLDLSETLNLVPTRYEGVNLSVNHDPGSRGVFWNAGLGLSRSFIVSLPAGFYDATPGTPCSAADPGDTCSGHSFIPGINFTGAQSENGAQPYANGSATIGLRWSPQTYVSTTMNYYGNNNDYYRPAFAEFNAAASYGFTKNVSLLVSFRNLLNTNSGNVTCLYCTVGEVGAPSAVGPPWYTYPNPWGPRTAIVTLQFKQ